MLLALLCFGFSLVGGSPILIHPEVIWPLFLAGLVCNSAFSDRHQSAAALKIALLLRSYAPRYSKIQILDPLLI